MPPQRAVVQSFPESATLELSLGVTDDLWLLVKERAASTKAIPGLRQLPCDK